MLAKELKAQLHRCIEILPKTERELIQAIYFDGMSDTEDSKESESLNRRSVIDAKNIVEVKAVNELLVAFSVSGR